MKILILLFLLIGFIVLISLFVMSFKLLKQTQKTNGILKNTDQSLDDSSKK